MNKYIAIDIGGTNIKYGMVNDDGTVVDTYKIATEAKNGPIGIMDKVLNIVKSLSNEFKVDGILGVAISTAGQVDSKKGEIIFASDAIPGYTGFKVKEYLEEKIPYRVEVENDVNCAMLGEMWLGAAKDIEDSAMITIGTGIGGAICLDNKLFKGSNGSAGEIGYIRIGNDTFQNQASTSALVRKGRELLGDESLDGETLFEMAESNEDIQNIIDDFYDILAKGISNIIYMLDVNKIILGGAIASRSEFKSELNKKLSNYLIPTLQNKDFLAIAELENTAGMVGAVYNFKTVING